MRISSQGKNWLFYLKNDGSDRDTDEDSEDENELLPNNLNGFQLLAGATADLCESCGNILLGSGDK